MCPGEIVFTLEKPVSFNPLRLFTNPLNLLAYLRSPTESNSNLLKPRYRGEGPLASVSGFEGMAIYRYGRVRRGYIQV